MTSVFCLLAPVFLALALRLPGLTWGLPNAEHWYSYHPDERQIALAVSNVANDFNPHFFNYPSLFIYLTYFAYLAQNMLGLGTPPNGTPWPPLHDVILSGRFVCALLGAFTILAVYGIGKRIGSEKIGLFAAFLMAVAPGHVQHSHFATVDVPATFFVAWSLFFAVRALMPSPLTPLPIRFAGEGNQTPPPPGEVGWGQKAAQSLLISAFLAGLAAATKYNAGIVAIAPLLVAMQNEKGKIQNCCFVLALTAFGFVIGCPYSVLSTQEFLGDRQNQGVLYELFVHSRQGHGDVFTNTGNGWLYHLTFNLPFALTAPLTLIAVAGVFVAARSKNRLWLPLLGFAALYFGTLGLSQVRFMRYDLPLVPVLCLCAAFALAALPRPAKNLVAGALSLLVFIGATNVLYPFCVTDPRDQAAAYLKSKVTKPVTIALINRPWFYTPPLWPQDYPPPSDVTNGVSPDGRFRFDVVNTDILETTDWHSGQFDWLLINEFEWREQVRLGHKPMQELQYNVFYGGNPKFRNSPPLELPGRKFVPHDFLYSNPIQGVFRRPTPSSP